MKLMFFAGAAAAATLFTTAPAHAQSLSKTAGIRQDTRPYTQADEQVATSRDTWAVFNLTVTDTENNPIEGAQVTIGDITTIDGAIDGAIDGTIDGRIDGTTLTTDHDGHVAIPQTWRDPQPVTIDAASYIRATYLALNPQVTTLQVRRAKQSISNPSTRFELKGNSSGFGNLKNDGIFDIGLIVQSIPRAQLSTVSLQSLISPETDHFTVLGQSVDLPSNITIPDQTESYFFPLHFAKPDYRLYLPQNGAWQISALHAQVPFKSTIDALQSGKSMVDIVNTFDFKEGSITAVNLTQPSTSQDLLVNQIKFTKSLKFTSPAYDTSLNLLAISLANTNGSYYPTDIKNVASNTTVQLSAPPNPQDGMILAAYKKAGAKSVGPESDQISAVTLPNNEARPFDPIRLVNSPQVNADHLILDVPTPTSDLIPVMTYGVFSVVTQITQGKLNVETKQPLWDVYAPAWVGKLDLPKQTPPALGPNQKLRWEVGFSAQFTGQKSLPPGPGALEKITHVSRSAVDL